MTVYILINSLGVVTSIGTAPMGDLSLAVEVQSLSDMEFKSGFIKTFDGYSLKNVRDLSQYAKEQERIFKSAKEAAISNIEVKTSSGKSFDGDEVSQGRMLRAIGVASLTNSSTTLWKLSDNKTEEVSFNDLKEALTLAGKEMSRIWLEE